MTTSSERRQLLADSIRERRIELGLRQEDLKDLGGPSGETVSNYESGEIPENPQDRTLAGVDTALRWQLGSSRSILNGGKPATIDVRAEYSTARVLREHIAEVTGESVDTKKWCAVPRHSIQDLAITAAKLSALTRHHRETSPDVFEVAAQIHLLAADLLALCIGTDRSDDELISLIGSLTPRERNVEITASDITQ